MDNGTSGDKRVAQLLQKNCRLTCPSRTTNGPTGGPKYVDVTIDCANPALTLKCYHCELVSLFRLRNTSQAKMQGIKMRQNITMLALVCHTTFGLKRGQRRCHQRFTLQLHCPSCQTEKGNACPHEIAKVEYTITRDRRNRDGLPALSASARTARVIVMACLFFSSIHPPPSDASVYHNLAISPPDSVPLPTVTSLA